ncbi:pre-toxin TG domain-containing protein [Bacillus pumilus]|nr:pre-toxin TG domain-containing protein [Bacillus pumilus]
MLDGEVVSTTENIILEYSGIYDGYRAVTGKDPETSQNISSTDKALSAASIIPITKIVKVGKYVFKMDQGKNAVKRVEKAAKDIKNLHSAFADRAKLEGHFDKHGKEFSGLYRNANEYLEGAKVVINSGIKVKYQYKGEIRTGYVKFMGNNKSGKAKFEFVGTNNKNEITTYHTQSGKKIWKTINGENIPVINPSD